MILYLMQHGKPVSKDENPERPISEQGSDDIKKVGAFLKKSKFNINEIWHSGKTRARQTAEIFISELGLELDPVERKGLSPLDDVDDILPRIKTQKNDLMIVGHLPHLGKLVSMLITDSESVPFVSFQQGCIVCLVRNEEMKGRIGWMLTPDIM